MEAFELAARMVERHSRRGFLRRVSTLALYSAAAIAGARFLTIARAGNGCCPSPSCGSSRCSSWSYSGNPYCCRVGSSYYGCMGCYLFDGTLNCYASWGPMGSCMFQPQP